MAVGETINDGSVVWKKDFIMSLSKLPLAVGYNHKETFTTSGSFTAPITGLYKVTLQGGGGGAGGAGKPTYGGGGGGSGAKLVFYEQLVAGESYSYIIGAGGKGGEGATSNGTNDGSQGSMGGNSTITINDNTYVSMGGLYGYGSQYSNGMGGGYGGLGYINNTVVTRGFPGSPGAYQIQGGLGGGEGASNISTHPYVSPCGCGGTGANGSGGFGNGGNGSDGYITFEWFDPADVWPDLFPATA